MSTIFRAVWGDLFGNEGQASDQFFDLLMIAKNPNERHNDKPPTMLVFGSDNMSIMEDAGFKCVLVDRRHTLFPKDKTFMHKVLTWEAGTSLDGQSLFVDLDCHQASASLPANFWGAHEMKSPIQAPLCHYRRKVATWRERNQRTMPCGCYVYLRGEEAIRMVRKGAMLAVGHFVDGKINDEMVLVMAIEEMDGRWHGVDHYVAVHSPTMFEPGYVPGIPKAANPAFVHYYWDDHVYRAMRKRTKFTSKQEACAALKRRMAS